MTDIQITDQHVCVGCLKPAGASQSIGDPCPHDCEYCQIVRRIEQGRYSVEIAREGDRFQADGFIRTALSREFSARRYVSEAAAEHRAYQWLQRKSE